MKPGGKKIGESLEGEKGDFLCFASMGRRDQETFGMKFFFEKMRKAIFQLQERGGGHFNVELVYKNYMRIPTAIF